MKLHTHIHKIVKNDHKIFRKDPCTNARTRGINVRARVLSRQNVRAHVYASCARVCARILTKNLVIILYYLMNMCLKFHKDWSFRWGDTCKTILSFKNHQFSMYFAYFHSFALPKGSFRPEWYRSVTVWHTFYKNVQKEKHWSCMDPTHDFDRISLINAFSYLPDICNVHFVSQLKTYASHRNVLMVFS